MGWCVGDVIRKEREVNQRRNESLEEKRGGRRLIRVDVN